MKTTEPVVGIGVTLGMAHGETRADFVITKDNRLVMQVREDAINIDLCLGRATKNRVGFIIECLERIKSHALDE